MNMMKFPASEDDDDDKKNKDFAQIYSKGWRRLRWLMKQKPQAAHVYSFIAEHMDPDGGAVVASQVVLAEALGVSEITIRRTTKWLEDNNVIVRIRVGSGVYAYALDPDEVWKAWNTQKDTAIFKTRTLVKKRDRGNSHVQRRIKTMLKEPELPFDDITNFEGDET